MKMDCGESISFDKKRTSLEKIAEPLKYKSFGSGYAVSSRRLGKQSHVCQVVSMHTAFPERSDTFNVSIIWGMSAYPVRVATDL